MKLRFSLFFLMTAILFTAFAGPLVALESVDIHTGLLYIGTPLYEPASLDGLPTGGPAPLVNAFVVSLPFELGPYFRFAFELTLFGTQYAALPGYDKVVPVEREYASAIWFLGSMIDLSLWLDIPLGNDLGLGFTIGPAFLARAPITAWGTGWDELETQAQYFYGDGRFFYPETGFFLTWRPSQIEGIEVAIRGRAYFPIFHLWDNEAVSFIDQFIATATIGIRIYPAISDKTDENSGDGAAE